MIQALLLKYCAFVCLNNEILNAFAILTSSL